MGAIGNFLWLVGRQDQRAQGSRRCGTQTGCQGGCIQASGKPLMKRLPHLACACSLLMLVHFGSHAQELAHIKASPPEVGIGEKVEIAIDLKHIDNSQGCGLLVDFGDGSSTYIRVAAPSLSFVVPHTYKEAGSAVIKVNGETRFRGLKTSFACMGGAKITAVNVLPEDFAARRAAALAEKEAALKRAETDNRAAQAAAVEARRQRSAAELATQRARADKTAAEKLAQGSAAQRAAAQRQAATTQPANSARVAQPSTTPAPRPAVAPGAPPAVPALKPKADQPKPKSSLDL